MDPCQQYRGLGVAYMGLHCTQCNVLIVNLILSMLVKINRRHELLRSLDTRILDNLIAWNHMKPQCCGNQHGLHHFFKHVCRSWKVLSKRLRGLASSSWHNIPVQISPLGPGSCHCLGAGHTEAPKRILCRFTIGTWCFEKGWAPSVLVVSIDLHPRKSSAHWKKYVHFAALKCFQTSEGPWKQASFGQTCSSICELYVHYIRDVCTFGVVYLWASNCSSFSCNSHPSGKVLTQDLPCISDT